MITAYCRFPPFPHFPLGSFNRIDSISLLYHPPLSWTMFTHRIYNSSSELHLTHPSSCLLARHTRVPWHVGNEHRPVTKYTEPFSYNKNVQDSLAPAVRNLRFAVHPEPTPRTSTDCYIQHGELRAEHTAKANSKGARTLKYGDSESPLSYIHICHSCHSSATSSREGERGFFIIGVGACCARDARGAYSGSRKRGS